MPPKKSSKPSSKTAKKPPSKASPPKKQDGQDAAASTSGAAKTGTSSPSKAGEKRKRSSSPQLSDDSLKTLLRFLVNDANTKFGSEKPDQPNLFDHMDPSSEYTPWQNLVGSVVMSKPISSRLGVRTLRTIFGDEIDYTTPEKVREAGGDGRYEALSKARTQHKDKTSLQLGRLADSVIENYSSEPSDTSLSKLRDACEGSDTTFNAKLKEFYGFGETAADLFKRRIQADWEEFYPFADERALNAAAHLGLASEDPRSLADQVNSLLSSDDKDAERRQFVRVVDALIATDLEHRYEDLLDLAAAGGKEDQSTVDEPEEKKAKTE